MTDERDSAFLDIEAVQAELAPILATGSWTRAGLEEIKSYLMRWMDEMSEGAAPNPELAQQHHDADDPLDNAILAEHERVDAEDPGAPEASADR